MVTCPPCGQRRCGDLHGGRNRTGAQASIEPAKGAPVTQQIGSAKAVHRCPHTCTRSANVTLARRETRFRDGYGGSPEGRRTLGCTGVDNSYRSGGADESDAVSAPRTGSMPAWAPLRSGGPTGPAPPKFASRSELVTATALLSRAASVVPAVRQSRPGCRQRRERTMNGGKVPSNRPGEPTWVLSVRSAGRTQIVSGSSGDGSRSYLSSTVDVTGTA